MKKLNLILILFIVTALSCSKNNLVDTPIYDLNIYQTTSLDYNKDGNSDLILKLINSGTSNIPQSAGSNSFFISSADSNLTFLSKSAFLDDYLYEENKVINLDTAMNFSYKYFYTYLYTRDINKGNYSSDWKISEAFSKHKILIFKDKRVSNTKYGWIKIDFDFSTKKLILVDYYETTLKSITTGKK